MPVPWERLSACLHPTLSGLCLTTGPPPTAPLLLAAEPLHATVLARHPEARSDEGSPSCPGANRHRATAPSHAPPHNVPPLNSSPTSYLHPP